jgi:hypothetical protein
MAAGEGIDQPQSSGTDLRAVCRGDSFTHLRDQPSGGVSGGAFHHAGYGGIEIHPSPLLAECAIICMAFTNFKKLSESFQN